MSFEWFTSVVDGKAVLNGNINIGVSSSAASSWQVRACLEFVPVGSEFDWREQIIFHGDVAGGYFDYDNIGVKPGVSLKDGKALCTTVHSEGDGFLTDGGYIITKSPENDVNKINQKDGDKTSHHIKFTRDFEVDYSQAMDFVGDTTYKAFMTYFISSPTSSSQRRCYGDFNVVDGVSQPIF